MITSPSPLCDFVQVSSGRRGPGDDSRPLARGRRGKVEGGEGKKGEALSWFELDSVYGFD